MGPKAMTSVTSSTNPVKSGQRRELEPAAEKLQTLLSKSIHEKLGDSLLLSGGLDTSIIAAVVSPLCSVTDFNEKSNEKKTNSFRCYTVIMQGAPTPDLDCSKKVSSRFALPHEVYSISLSELEDHALPDVIGILKSFDPMEIRNSVAVYIGMKRAKLDGCSKIMTGDGADELFAGYNFVIKQPEQKARETLSHLWDVMHFSSIPMAKSLGMEAMLPFLQPDVKEFAMKEVDFSLLTGKSERTGEILGKFILRRAFKDVLPQEITWRTKTPIEHGCGTTILPKVYAQIIDETQFAEKKRRYLERDGVKLRDPEQLKYYEIYRRLLGPPAPRDGSKQACPACTSNVPEAATFCTICGEYPI